MFLIVKLPRYIFFSHVLCGLSDHFLLLRDWILFLAVAIDMWWIGTFFYFCSNKSFLFMWILRTCGVSNHFLLQYIIPFSVIPVDMWCIQPFFTSIYHSFFSDSCGHVVYPTIFYSNISFLFMWILRTCRVSNHFLLQYIIPFSVIPVDMWCIQPFFFLQ